MSPETRHTILVALTLLLVLGSLICYSYREKRWKRVLAAAVCVAICISWQAVFKLTNLYALIAGMLAIYAILLISWKKKS